jgi:hypothetical protein
MEHLHPSTVGALRELIAASDLMKKGWEVFRSMSPACPCDLIIMSRNVMLRVEVRTGRRKKAGGIFVPKHGDYDILAVVIRANDEVLYFGPGGEEPMDEHINGFNS